jgi:hypothetical protein
MLPYASEKQLRAHTRNLERQLHSRRSRMPESVADCKRLPILVRFGGFSKFLDKNRVKTAGWPDISQRLRANTNTQQAAALHHRLYEMAT